MLRGATNNLGAMTIRLGLSVIIIAGALTAACGLAEARTRALVVGAAGYPALPEQFHLKGPRNDTREVANTLVSVGVAPDDVTVLADGVEGLAAGIAAPRDGTKAAILAELDKLAETSEAGDLVVFYFSGHGSQQPDENGDEQGGNDEIILPYDVAKSDGEGIKNALVDDELDLRVRKLLDKGVDFFGIIDACHSATGFRAVEDDDTRSREIDPQDLGVPASALATETPGNMLKDVASDKPGRGRAAYFYAAQESEVALEKVPKGAEPGQSFGVFTYNLLRRLNENPDVTYRTLHQAVIDSIKRGSLMATQTPELEGELLDEPVLRLTDAKPLRQWPIFAGKLQAGELSGLSNGTIMALYNDAADADDKVLAYGEIEAAGATQSRVVAVAYPCGEALSEDGSCPTPPDEAAFKKGRFARVVEPGVDLSVTLSEPVRVDPKDGHDYGAAIAALESAVHSDGLSRRVSLNRSGYDVAVGLLDGKLAFSATGGQFDANGAGSSPRLTLPDNSEAATAVVASAVNRIAKVMALQRMAGLGAEEKFGLGGEISLIKAKPEAVLDGACSDDRSNYAPPAETGDAPPRLAACDILSVSMQNNGQKPLDVTILLVGADFSIEPLWPVDGADNRIAIGESRTRPCAECARRRAGQRPAACPGNGARRRQVAYGVRQPWTGRAAQRRGRGRRGHRRAHPDGGRAERHGSFDDQPAAAHRRGDIYLDKTVLRWGMRAATGNGRLGHRGTLHRNPSSIRFRCEGQ